MAKSININTDSFLKKEAIEIDGKVWQIMPLGSKSELEAQQATRRSKLYAMKVAGFDQIVDKGERLLTKDEMADYESALESLEKCEQVIKTVFLKIFKDGSENNKGVQEWIDKTHLA